MPSVVTTIDGLDAQLTQDAPPRPAGRMGRLAAAVVARPDIRNGALSLFDQAVVSATAFATSVLIGRACSKEDLGIFFLAMTIVYLARGIQEQLISAPYVIYYHGRHDEARALYTGSSLVHQLALCGVGCVVLLGILALLSTGAGPDDLSPAVWALLGALPLLQLREFVRRLAIAHLQMATAAAIDVCVAVFQIGALFALAYFHQLTVTRAYLVMGGACAIACGAWFLARRQPLRVNLSGAVSDWWHNWGFARWALASHLVGFATPYLMPWIVTVMLGSGEAGAFAACVGVVGMASMFMTGLASFLIPRAAMAFSHGGAVELKRVLRWAIAVYAVVLGSFAIFALVSGDLLLVMLFGAKYAGYGAVMGVLALSMAALSMGLTAGIGLWAIDRPQSNLTADVCTMLVTLTIVFFLLEPMGVLGAALGDLGGKIAGALVRYETLRRLLKSAPRSAQT